jgi:hypothetical protein
MNRIEKFKNEIGKIGSLSSGLVNTLWSEMKKRCEGKGF